MPAFIIRGSMIMPATRPSCSTSARSRMARSLKGTTTARSTMACGMPLSGRDRSRPVARTELVDVAVHGDHDRVVVAVVAALDLDDQVFSGDRPHQVHRVHRGFGAGVAEPPQRQTEAAGELLGDHDGILGGLREVRAEPHSTLDRIDDGRMGMADDHHAIAGMQIHILHAIDVVHLRAVAMAEPHGARPGDHPARGRSARERTSGPLRPRRRVRLAAEEAVLLPGDQIRDRGPGTRGISEQCHRLSTPSVPGWA